jgi:putative FmdB family regulatory protein
VIPTTTRRTPASYGKKAGLARARPGDLRWSAEPMPIYEFYCRHCHRVMSFLSRAVDTERTPACPHCRRTDLLRRASAFAISKGRKEEPKPEAPPLPGLDEARLEKAMESLAGDLDSLDENDPKQGAQLMRRLFSATGMPIKGEMAEALRRMESGEDPEKIEEDMGDVLEQDPFGGLLGGEAEDAASGDDPARKGLGRLRRMLPPAHDSELYEM